MFQDGRFDDANSRWSSEAFATLSSDEEMNFVDLILLGEIVRYSYCSVCCRFHDWLPFRRAGGYRRREVSGSLVNSHTLLPRLTCRTFLFFPLGSPKKRFFFIYKMEEGPNSVRYPADPDSVPQASHAAARTRRGSWENGERCREDGRERVLPAAWGRHEAFRGWVSSNRWLVGRIRCGWLRAVDI